MSDETQQEDQAGQTHQQDQAGQEHTQNEPGGDIVEGDKVVHEAPADDGGE